MDGRLLSSALALIVPGIAFLAAPRPSVAAVPEDVPTVDFRRDVQPILAEHCYGCHGPDDATREGDLRLDLREEVFADRGGYSIVVPGDPSASELLARVFDDDDPMPPVDMEPISAAEKDLLRAWVTEGADWPGHWSFEPPRRGPAPSVTDDAWVRDPIDRFVLARIEAAGLKPAAEATPAAWLRRASFDLTGLPPTIEELDEFERAVADLTGEAREAAYATEVDRLLASPRYGERQAQDWLDLARYADSNGNQFDEPRSQWKWRDWVIDAFNANMPYDQFTIEQLAGDLLPDPTLSQLVATGFNRNHPTDTDAPAEIDEYRTEYVMDRVHTTATTFLGLTLACAQCHDHKYDPLTQEDFYSFYAFFNSVAERDVDYGNPRPRIHVPNPDQAPLLEEYEARIKELKERLKSDDALLDAEQEAWEAATLERLGPAPEWAALAPVSQFAKNGSWLRTQDDGSILAAGPTPVNDTYELVFQPGKRTIEALRLELLPDPSHDGKLGRGHDGRFRLARVEIRQSSLTDAITPPLVHIAAAEADLRQVRDEEKEVFEHHAMPGDVESATSGEVYNPDAPFSTFVRGGWSLVNEAMAEPHEAVFVPLEPMELNDASLVRITMHQIGGRPKSLVGRFRWSATDDARVRRELLPMAGREWSSLGPFPAEDAMTGFATAFAPEADFEDGVQLLKKYTLPKEEKAEGTSTSDGDGKSDDDAKKPDAARAGDERDAVRADARDGREGDEARGADESPAERRKPDKDRDRDAEEDDDRGDEDDDEEEDEPKRLAWKEQPTWRDGARATLSGAGVHYLTRTVVSDAPRTARLRLDGPAAVKVWLNGEEVFADPPPPKAPTGDKKDDDDADEFAAFFGGGRDTADRETRLGFRAGENTLVVKAVFEKPKPPTKRGGGGFFGGGGRSGLSITFDLTPEGDDLLSYEIIQALRAKAAGEEAPASMRAEGDGEESAEAAAAKLAATYSPDVLPPSPIKTRTRDAILREHFRSKVSTFGRVLTDQLAELKQEKDAFTRDIPEVMVMKDLEVPRRTFVFHRGDYRLPRHEVRADTPTVLPPLPPEEEGGTRNRLDLARWITSPENPLFARVAVNRAWQQAFGTGLVATPGDFGVRGELPSHPGLLDELAMDFAEGGYDLKALHKRIALSATYRQASVTTPEKAERDPKNRLISRGPRTRLSAEMVRDQALAVSGLLKNELGGKSVKPYQAKGLWTEVTGGRDWKRDTGEKQYRRGVYVYRKRRVPYASMKSFDRESGETCLVSRPETITPLQALVLLNNPIYVEAARKLAERILTEGGDDDAERIAFAFRVCSSREPTAAETEVLVELLASQRAAYKDDEKAAKKLLKVGDAPVAEKLDAKEVAAWSGVATALFNLDLVLHKG